MRIPPPRKPQGIAMIIVMVVVLTLGVLAGGFAYSMKVETKLAKNTSLEEDIEWLGRSGVELAKYVVGQQLNLTPMFTALNQKWAGAMGNTNDILAPITLDNIEMGSGVFTVRIVDLERKWNINMADPEVLRQAFTMVGADVRDASSISEAIQDWLDSDETTRLGGAESDDYYMRQPRPYYAKNGPLGDISELLQVRGVTPEVFWGTTEPPNSRRLGLVNPTATPGVGLYTLFTAMGGPMININTASTQVLQLIPGLDSFMASSILQARAGFDGQEGTQDDVPFSNVGEMLRILNLPPILIQSLARYCQVHSFTFEVTVLVKVDRYQRRFKALLRRVSATDVQTLYLFWE